MENHLAVTPALRKQSDSPRFIIYVLVFTDVEQENGSRRAKRTIVQVRYRQSEFPGADAACVLMGSKYVTDST